MVIRPLLSPYFLGGGGGIGGGTLRFPWWCSFLTPRIWFLRVSPGMGPNHGRKFTRLIESFPTSMDSRALDNLSRTFFGAWGLQQLFLSTFCIGAHHLYTILTHHVFVFRKKITGPWRASWIWSKHFLWIFAQIRTLKKWQLKCDLQMFFVIEELAHPFFSLAGQWKRSGVFFPKRKFSCWGCTRWKKCPEMIRCFFLTNISHAIWRNAFSNSTPLLFEQCSGGRLKKKNWGILRPKDWERVYILLFLLVGLKPTRSSSWLLQRCEMMRWFIHEAENELNTTRLLQAMIHCSKGSMLRSSICQQTNINKSMRLCKKKRYSVQYVLGSISPPPMIPVTTLMTPHFKGKAAIPNLNLLPLASFLASWAWGLGPKYVRHGKLGCANMWESPMISGNHKAI